MQAQKSQEEAGSVCVASVHMSEQYKEVCSIGRHKAAAKRKQVLIFQGPAAGSYRSFTGPNRSGHSSPARPAGTELQWVLQRFWWCWGTPWPASSSFSSCRQRDAWCAVPAAEVAAVVVLLKGLSLWGNPAIFSVSSLLLSLKQMKAWSSGWVFQL